MQVTPLSGRVGDKRSNAGESGESKDDSDKGTNVTELIQALKYAVSTSFTFLKTSYSLTMDKASHPSSKRWAIVRRLRDIRCRLLPTRRRKSAGSHPTASHFRSLCKRRWFAAGANLGCTRYPRKGALLRQAIRLGYAARMGACRICKTSSLPSRWTYLRHAPANCQTLSGFKNRFCVRSLALQS